MRTPIIRFTNPQGPNRSYYSCTEAIPLGSFTGVIYIAAHAVACYNPGLEPLVSDIENSAGTVTCETGWAAYTTSTVVRGKSKNKIVYGLQFPGKDWAAYLYSVPFDNCPTITVMAPDDIMYWIPSNENTSSALKMNPSQEQ
jgi:hypothetical protein